MSAKHTLCCIVPCFNEEESIHAYIQAMDRIAPVLSDDCGYDLSYVFVDDGSSDRTLYLLREYCSNSPCSHYVSFTRNFGKEAALYAGMSEALQLFRDPEDLFCIMDVDLQDPPDLLVRMLDALNDSTIDVAAAFRVTRKGESALRSAFAHLFYRIVDSISEVHMKDGARDFRVMRRAVIESVVSLSERVRFSKGLLIWGGYSTAWIGYENHERSHGSSKWNLMSLARYALDGIVAFSTVPLEILSLGGLIVFLLSLLFLIFIIVRALLFGDPVSGWPSLVCIITLLSGLQLLGMGVLGLYLSKIYTEVKSRPLFIVKERG